MLVLEEPFKDLSLTIPFRLVFILIIPLVIHAQIWKKKTINSAVADVIQYMIEKFES